MNEVGDKQSDGASSDPAPDFPPVKAASKADPNLESLSEHDDQAESIFGIYDRFPQLLGANLRPMADMAKRTNREASAVVREQEHILGCMTTRIREATSPGMLAAAIDEDELESIRKRRNKVEMAMDEEVAIAERMYDIIDSTIKDVDEQIALLQWNEETQGGGLLRRSILEQYPTPEPSEATANSAPGAGWDMRTDSTPSDAEHGSAALDRVGSSGGDAAGKKAVGSDESAYCICRREGHGEMIECDNDGCKHGKWFDYGCVGLDTHVSEVWLCPGCSRDPGLEKVLLSLYQDQAKVQRMGWNYSAVKVARKKRSQSDYSSSLDESDDTDDSEAEDSQDSYDSEDGTDGASRDENDESSEISLPHAKTSSGTMRLPGQATAGTLDSTEHAEPPWRLGMSGQVFDETREVGGGHNVPVSAGVTAGRRSVSALREAGGQEIPETSALRCVTEPGANIPSASTVLATDTGSTALGLTIEPRLPE